MTTTIAREPWGHFDGPEPQRPRRADGFGGAACWPGEPKDPSHWCTRHPDHHYCETCVGWYGASHDMPHVVGGDAHPREWSDQCACRVCRAYNETTLATP